MSAAKKRKCTHCKHRLEDGEQMWDKDGWPICKRCWEAEEEELSKADANGSLQDS